MSGQKKQKIDKEFQKRLNENLENLSKAKDFKEYFKIQRDIIREFVSAWKYVEIFLEKDPLEQYYLLIKSFAEKARLDKKNNKIDSQKFEVIEKFNKQILDSFEKNDYVKTSQQLFYVLLGNVLEYIGKGDVDINKFDIQKDLYPELKYPLGLAFFLFQNLTFGPITQKINSLSKEYLQKYCALILGLWRIVFELMRYEKNTNKNEIDDEKTKVK